MRRYRKSAFKLKLKKQTIYTISSLGLLGTGIVVAVSFTQQGEFLTAIYNVLVSYFGWGILLLPILLISTSILFSGLKLKIAKLNVPAGLTLFWLSLLGLTRAGLIGDQLWISIENLITGAGALFMLLGVAVIGIVILFNTSLSDAFEIVQNFIKGISSLFQKFQKRKPVFVQEKLPVKVKGGILPEEQLPLLKDNKSKDLRTSDKEDLGLGTKLIANVPAETEIWEYPPNSLLSSIPGQKADRGDLKQNAAIIEKTLESFGITARVVEINCGPAVTQYALEIALGTKLSKITTLQNDLALALAAPTGQIRMEAPIPGRSLVGVEIPNRSLEFVTLKTMLSSEALRNAKSKLAVSLGLDVSGTPIIADICKMPHVLIAGTTGSGKSVLINSWISSILYRTTPNEVKLILVDPKRVELIGYNGIPHLLTPVIVDVDKILSALKWAMKEMDRRYELFAGAGVRNIAGYNEQSGFQAIPYIVIFIDELADIMAYAPVEVEDAICRIAQMARATGIHLVVSTQRPSVDVITGLIKANIPARIAFNVSSMIDSKVIIDMPGAEKLLGRGDMLYIPPDQAKPTRIQGTFVSEQEVQKLVEFLKNKGTPVEYTEEVTSMPVGLHKKGTLGNQDSGKDELFEEAMRIVCQFDRASASLLQRKLQVGYARAARIIDQLEEAGIVGPGEGSKPRDVLVRNADEYLNNQQEQS